jgi:hypothetical protein
MTTIVEKEIDGFLKLPDWKKLELRRGTKYINFPLMTKEQETDRTLKIFSILCHFGDTTMDDLDANPFVTLDGAWPPAYDCFLTPRLLDVFDINFIIKLSHCLYCRYWDGYRREFIKIYRLRSIGVLPISGYCVRAVPAYGRTRESMISPHSKCSKWEPAEFYRQVIMQRILTEIEKTGYTHEEFLKDKKYVDFWNFFFSGTSK